MSEENNTSQSLPEGQPEGGGEAVSTSESIKDVLGKTLGKEFPDDDTALKAVKDTFNFVGKREEDIKKQVAEEMSTTQTVEELQRKLDDITKSQEELKFYAEHPEYNNDEAKTLLRRFGNNPYEAVKDEDFKGLYEKVQKAQEIERSRSVLQPNSKLGAAADKMTKARESLEKGDDSSARNSAVGAVLDAYES